MKIARILMVAEASRSAPDELSLRVVFLDDPHKDHSQEDEASFLILDKNTARRYGIPYSLDAFGKEIVCTLTSCPYPLTEPIENNILVLKEIREERRSGHHCTTFSIPPFQTETEECYTLKLVTPGKGGLQHRLPPRPFYELIFELTKKECREHKNLPQDSVFAVEFHLKP
ncbi:hypothetical protein HY839_01270 [Candidatus Azambacteria bacterium]|nr:hypothetical protein [Candidatus Azambacteria bacterium]